MNHLIILDPFTPIHPVEQQVRRRYECLDLPLPFEEFRSRTAAAVSSSGTATAPTLNSGLAQNWGHSNQHRSARKRIRRTAELLVELERALFLCMVARLPTPKPSLTILCEAIRCCDIHDAHAARHAKEDEAAKCRCAHGGRARHRDHRRIQRLTIRFLRTKAPAGKWKSKSHAADTISHHLTRLVVEHGLQVSNSFETRMQNVLDLTRTDPRAAEEFELHRCPRRSNRSHRLP